MLTTKEKEILEVIKKRKEYEDHFFQKVNDPRWFDDLAREGYFNPERAPSCLPAKDPGYFVIPQWNVIEYLVRVSKMVTVSGNEAYTIKLLNIVSSITKYHVEHHRELDNYRTWDCFIRILLNMPNKVITSYLKENRINFGQDWAREWIASKFDNIVPASDLATKLLPKFLTDNTDDIIIAEQIIDVITNIKDDYFKEDSTQRIVVFEKKKEAKTTVDAYWLLESFNKNSQKIGELCSVSLIITLANRLKVILNKEHEDHQVLIEMDDKAYRIKAKRTNEFDFQFLVEKLHQAEIEALRPEDRYFGVLQVKGDTQLQFQLTSIKDINSFVDSAKVKIVADANTAFLNHYPELNKKLSNLYQGLYTDYSTIWIKSIASGPETRVDDAKEILTIFIRDILLAKCKSDSNKGKEIIEKFLGDEYQFPLFRRLALYAIGSCWSDDYKKLFWHFLDKNPDIFEDSYYEVELYKLLQLNTQKLDDGVEKPRLKVLISAGPKDLRYIEDKKDKKAKYIAHWKQKWYSALSADPDFQVLIEEQGKITGVKEVESPSESAFIKPRWGEGSSPLDKDAVMRLAIPDLVKYLDEFKTKDTWEGPTEEGLAETLRVVVKENPDKYINELTSFQKTNYRYVYSILHGIEDVWKEKKSVDWGKVFEFSKQYIDRSDFLEAGKKAQGEDWHPYHIWILNVLADLIQEGSRDDSWAFAEEHFLKADEILTAILSILKKQPKKEEKTRNDHVTEALNTTYGRTVIALILFSLRKARIQDKKEPKPLIRWDSKQYEELLKDKVIEAYTLFGQYMPNLSYLNRPWVEEKIKNFEALSTDDTKWEAFMEGYLFGHRIYQDLYKLMRNHYVKGMDNGFKGDRSENRLVQHVTIGYLRGTESIDGDDSLFKRILDKWDVQQYKEIVSFFWSEGRRIVEETEKKTIEKEDEDIKERMLKFWSWTYEQRETIQSKLKKECPGFMSDLSRLTLLLGKITPEYAKWILLVAPHVGADFDSTFFIEYLNRFSDKESYGYLGTILLEMLKTGTPTYHEDHIVSIVEKIYKYGDKAQADKICNTYASRGCEFLRKTYDENNVKVKP